MERSGWRYGGGYTLAGATNANPRSGSRGCGRYHGRSALTRLARRLEVGVQLPLRLEVRAPRPEPQEWVWGWRFGRGRRGGAHEVVSETEREWTDVNLKLSTQPLRGLSGATKPLPTRAGRPPACWEPRRASLAISMWQLHVGLGVGLEPRICTARSDLATRAQSRRSHQTAACSRKRARGADSLRGNAPRSRQSLMLSRPEEARGKQCV